MLVLRLLAVENSSAGYMLHLSVSVGEFKET